MGFSPDWQTGPLGQPADFAPYRYHLTDKYDANSNNIGAGTSAITLPGGGTNYLAVAPTGATTTTNVSPETKNAITGECSSTFTTVVKPGTGEITTTETLKCTITASQSGLDSILKEVNTAVSAFVNDVYSAVSYVASAAQSLATSFGGWVEHTWNSLFNGVTAPPHETAGLAVDHHQTGWHSDTIHIAHSFS